MLGFATCNIIYIQYICMLYGAIIKNFPAGTQRDCNYPTSLTTIYNGTQSHMKTKSNP
jgi:hypothetical protein